MYCLNRTLTVITCLLLFVFPLCSSSQSVAPKSFTQQLSVTTDNDRYLMQGRDRYYTNGIILNYSRAVPAKKTSVRKRINSYELGQKLFTPYSRKIYVASQIDRPVTGYLYGKFLQSNFIQHDQMWQWGVSVGAIGKMSLGESMQDAFHKVIHVNSDWWGWVWDYQLKSEAGINLHGSYAKGLIKGKPSSYIQITPVTQAVLGTTFTNISQGVLLQLGKINNLYQSGFFNAQLKKNKEGESPKTELFFYYYPQLMYQGYNATVQGGMFRKDKGPITSEIETFMMIHQLGGQFSWRRYTLKLEATIQSKEASSQLFHHTYGSLHLAYRFQ